MGYAGAWQLKVNDPDYLLPPPQLPRDRGVDRSKDVGGRTADKSPVLDASMPLPPSDGWADAYMDGGFGAGMRQVHIPSTQTIPSGRGIERDRSADSGQDAYEVKDRTSANEHLIEHGVKISSVMDVSTPTMPLPPAAAYTRGLTADPERNSFARSAREWFTRVHRDRYMGWRMRHHERPNLANPAVTSQDSPPGMGGLYGTVYSTLESFVNLGLRDPHRVRGGTPASPTNVVPIPPSGAHYEDTGVVVHLG